MILLIQASFIIYFLKFFTFRVLVIKFVLFLLLAYFFFFHFTFLCWSFYFKGFWSSIQYLSLSIGSSPCAFCVLSVSCFSSSVPQFYLSAISVFAVIILNPNELWLLLFSLLSDLQLPFFWCFCYLCFDYLSFQTSTLSVFLLAQIYLTSYLIHYLHLWCLSPLFCFLSLILLQDFHRFFSLIHFLRLFLLFDNI